MKRVALADAQHDLSKLLRAARKEKIMITLNGKPAGALVGFANDDERFDFELENDPRFLKRIACARRSARAGKGRRIEEIP
ncbi:MAG: type II toxin-antitoxin system prevent-host-death family antitoxin [Candidatus Aminicenantales bacterium]|jgi:prevent-host-death family protein